MPDDQHDDEHGVPTDGWKHTGVRVVPGDSLDTNTAQTPGMNRAAAINFARVGAQKLWAGTVHIHADAKTGAHHHGALESVIYIVSGRARMRWGEQLEYVAEAGPGDFIFVPPYVPHQEINASTDEPLECVLVRSDNEAVVVNLDIAGVEAPETVRWIDPIHRDDLAARVITELDVPVGWGSVHAYDTGPVHGAVDGAALAVVWHHGTPNIGTPPAPLFAAAEALGVRWIGFDRPGYGGSTAVDDRDVSIAATCAAAVADALGIERFAVMSHSGGGPHALAAAALLGGRVRAAAVVASLAPLDAAGLDWFAGMGPAGVATLRSAVAGRAARQRHEETAGDGMPDFVEADLATLRGEWGWFGSVVGPALASGPGPMIDDDLAYVRPWGFAVSDVEVPVLVVHGSADLVVPSGHGVWLAEHLPSAELWLTPDDGHLSVMRRAADALAWLRAAAT